MPLEFRGNAICLSGGTGTKLKSQLIELYYPFWWRITSGGDAKNHSLATAIIDLNAATGEVYLKDEQKTVLGSAGHALQLKVHTPNTDKLRVILIEEDPECFSRLKKVINNRWPSIPIDQAEGPVEGNESSVYLLNMTLEEALDTIQRIERHTDLGRTIFLFDPLRSVPLKAIQEVAHRRIRTFYQIGTEFMVFLFSSDMFLGRDAFAPLPRTTDENRWSAKERVTVAEGDALLGGTMWRSSLLNDDTVEERESRLPILYRETLHNWFRYILPLPFAPKIGQLYHLFLCSNYETGVRVTKSFFAELTGNPKYSPNNLDAYDGFRQQHPDKIAGLTGRKRPLEFRLLWKIIRDHEEGFCDMAAQDLIELEPSAYKRIAVLDWLWKNGYLRKVHYSVEWKNSAPTYLLDWKSLKARLGLDRPSRLFPFNPPGSLAQPSA